MEHTLERRATPTDLRAAVQPILTVEAVQLRALAASSRRLDRSLDFGPGAEFIRRDEDMRPYDRVFDQEREEWA